MSEAKFTKGEWKVIKSEDSFDDGELVISMASHQIDQSSFYCKHKILIAGTSGGDKEAVANAHLIAAAPEMYDALNTIKRHILNMPLCDSHLYNWVDENIDPLLAKARGES